MAKQLDNNYFGTYLDKNGHFGPYGGRFVGETLMQAIYQLEEAYDKYKTYHEFQD
jgi:tryptophan synthase beta chain